MVAMETRFLEILTAVLLASLWSSFVHCRVIGQTTGDSDTDMDGDDTSWPVLCPSNTFFDQSQDRCMECSQCPINEVILSPCGGLHNTKCGPLLSFDMFKSSNKDHKGNKKTLDKTSDHELDAVPNHSKDAADGKTKNLLDGNDETSTSEVETMVTEWKSLSLILIIVLTVVLAIFAVVVTAVCYVRWKSPLSPSTKEALCEYQPAPTKI